MHYTSTYIEIAIMIKFLRNILIVECTIGCNDGIFYSL